MKVISLFIFLFFTTLFADAQLNKITSLVAAKGRMPDLAKDENHILYLVYGSGDSIMYTQSKDGEHFATPALVAVLPKLFASAMRGPQITATSKGLVITACNSEGDIFSYTKEGTEKWTKAVRLNDAAQTAKEALIDVSADGLQVCAVWLGVKSTKGQNVYSTTSADGGKTWRKNVLVYASPDSTVCECCKPSVVVKGSNVYVMFRNWLGGNRDLYVTESSDGGASFTNAKKLGAGSWKLDGCPMDGGGLAVNKAGTVQTVWRRENKIYTAEAGKPEREIGEGKGCTIETATGANVYAWVANGEVILLKPQGQKIVIGKGNQPVLKALDNTHIVCVWESEQQIHSSLIQL